MINTELLLAAWLEKLQKKWDTEEYYYDVEEAKKVFKFVSKLTNDRGASRNFDLLEFQFEIITEKIWKQLHKANICRHCKTFYQCQSLLD